MRKYKLFRILIGTIVLMIFWSMIPSQIFAAEIKADFNTLLKKAERGDVGAQFDLGFKYDFGEGVPQDFKKAVYWYTKAAKQGHASAQYNLGWMYFKGEGVPHDNSQAIYWFTMAAEGGNAIAQYNLVAMYARGEYLPKNYEQSAYWYTKAAEQGDAESQFDLGLMYTKGLGVPKNLKQASYWYTKAAEQGHPRAQFKIGLMFLGGFGLSQDYKKAIYWLTKAAEQGDVDDQYYLGEKYLYGDEGIPQDYTQAAYWFTKAAEKGYARAQYTLGWMYSKGEGVPQDRNQGIYWTTMAAEQGYDKAQSFLGISYFYGERITQDYTQAAYWFTKAAEKGHAIAQFYLANMYYEGIGGLLQDYKQAVYWNTKSAEQGNNLGQAGLGVCYYNGQGVPQNYKLAYAWFNIAFTNGNEKAKEIRDLLAKNMTPQMLAEAQDLAAKIQYNIDHKSETSPSESNSSKMSISQEPKVKGFGSGFIISKDGFILTCYHVIKDSEIIKVKIRDKFHSAKLVYKDPNNDLALIKISGSFPALAFSPARTAKMGQAVFTIGYPNPILQGVNEKLTNGSINSLTGVKDDIRLYQISVPAQPGNSGGPLLDMDGNVIGIVVAMLDASTTYKISGSLPQNVNYAVKSAYAQAMIDTLSEVSGGLLPAFKKESFDKVVDRVKKSVVMIVVYE